MVICIIALVTFSILGIFSAKYRALAKESFDCVFRMVTLRPCQTNLDQRIKSKLTSKLMGRFPALAKSLYKYFGTLSWIFVITFFASMGYSAYGIYNLIRYGSCQPGSECVFSQETVLINIITCNEAKIVYTIITFVAIALLLIKYLNNKIKTKTKYLVGVLVIVAFVIALYLIINVFFVPPQLSNMDDFAKCLTEKGATFYGTYWCSHCTNQKKLFGSSLKYINFIECDPKGENAKPELCKQNNIGGYPTWIINEIHYEGEQSLEKLSSLTGCQLP